MEREYQDYDDWLRAGGSEGTGQQMEDPNLSSVNPPPNPFAPPQQGSPVNWGSMNPPQNVPGGWSDSHTGGFVPATSGNAGGYGDLSSWASRGVPADQIFDFATGQVRPGWTRSGSGYARSTAGAGPGGNSGGNQYPFGQPIPDSTPFGSGGGGRNPFEPGGGGINYGGGSPRGGGFPAYQDAGPFTPRNSTLQLDPFTPSNWDEAEREPGYENAQTKLRKQIEGGAAYGGMLRSGMTFDRLGDVLTNYGQQNFTNFDNRRFRNWQGNNDAKASAFGVNLGVDRDVYDRQASNVDRGNNYRFNVAGKEFDGEISKWLAQIQSLTSLARPVE